MADVPCSGNGSSGSNRRHQGRCRARTQKRAAEGPASFEQAGELERIWCLPPNPQMPRGAINSTVWLNQSRCDVQAAEEYKLCAYTHTALMTAQTSSRATAVYMVPLCGVLLALRFLRRRETEWLAPLVLSLSTLVCHRCQGSATRWTQLRCGPDASSAEDAGPACCSYAHGALCGKPWQTWRRTRSTRSTPTCVSRRVPPSVS